MKAQWGTFGGRKETSEGAGQTAEGSRGEGRTNMSQTQ